MDARDRRLHQKPGHESSGDGRLQHFRAARRIAGDSRRGHRDDASLSRREKIFCRTHPRHADKAKGKKPYVVGEFGFVSTAQMSETMQAIGDGSAAGGLLWSLRFRNRDGGFYWHSEPYGGNLYKAFHWPGSALGEPYDETKLLNL